jgi:sugar transferase EpsL
MNTKRVFDLFILVLFSLFWVPLLGALALLVRLKLGAPVFFCQDRPGFRESIFKIVKLRTMTEDRDAAGNLRPDAERLTPFGQWLRATSLDELPELWNVLRGEMSLVGPRPLMVQYLQRYTKEQHRRHDVMPGLTGWAQINGRNCISWTERFKLDVWYVDNWSTWLDCKILCLTVVKVLQRRDINAAGSATMPEFNPGDCPRSLITMPASLAPSSTVSSITPKSSSLKARASA